MLTLTPPGDQRTDPAPINGHTLHPAPAPPPEPDATSTPAASSKPPFMLTVIALLGAGLSFNAVRLMAEPFAGFYGGIATACLFDAGMWLSSRWYIRTVRDGERLRPALWLSLALVAVTLMVNIAPAHTLAQGIVHGIGPALFAAFTWLEAALVLREWRKKADVRDRIPFGYALAHPARAMQVTVMMLGSGEKAFTNAKAMCQNREAQRRLWKAAYRPRWLAFLLRTLRPGWRARVDPVLYTAYRWGAFDTSALILPRLGQARPGLAAHAIAATGHEAATQLAAPALPAPPNGQSIVADKLAEVIERALVPVAAPTPLPRVGGAARMPRVRPGRSVYRQLTGRISGHGPASATPRRTPDSGQDGGQKKTGKRPTAKPRSGQDSATKQVVAAFAVKHPDMATSAMAEALALSVRTVRRYRNATA